MRHVLVLALGASLAIPAAAQIPTQPPAADPGGSVGTCGRREGDELVSDRPDVTESATTVPAGCWQLEAGTTWQEVDDAESLNWGELLVRHGLGERWELRLGVPSYVDPEPGAAGFDDASLGLKLLLAHPAPGRPARPQAALLVQSTLPTGETGVREPHAQPAALLALAWPLGERTELAANVGAAYASTDGEQFGQGLASVAVGRELTGRLGGFVELYGVSRDEPGGEARSFFDAGLTWAVTADLQLDLRAGVELGSGERERLVGAGLVWRQ